MTARTHRRAALLLGTVLALAQHGTPAPAATVYKWTDEDGRTVYSERPPPGGAATVIEPRGGQASPEAIARMKAQSTRPADTPAESPAAQAEGESEEQKAEKAAACRQARTVLEQLTTSTRMQYVDESGQRAFLSEEQRQARLAEARKAIADYCK